MKFLLSRMSAGLKEIITGLEGFKSLHFVLSTFKALFLGVVLFVFHNSALSCHVKWKKAGVRLFFYFNFHISVNLN